MSTPVKLHLLFQTHSFLPTLEFLLFNVGNKSSIWF